MIGYKFLNPDGTGPYSGFSWPLPVQDLPSVWVEARGRLQLCRNGIHACRVGQLPYWWGPQLWEIEFTEPITDAGRVVLGARGRLLRRVGAWDEPTMRRYAQACAWRLRDHSMARLRARGRAGAAHALAASTGLDSLAATATALVDAVPDEFIVGYLADAASFATGSIALVKTVPYVTAQAAGYASGQERCPAYEQGYRAERQWQAAWLVEQLGLCSAAR